MRGLPFDENSHGRPLCYHCFRPCSHCVCSTITPFTAHCNILILQHSHEIKKYHSTARLVTRALKNSKLVRGIRFDPTFLKNELEGQKTYLLYPGKESIDCADVVFDSSTKVVVIDGTWSEAGKVMSRNPILQTLPRVSFSQTIRSTFYIRKQPKQGYLSTLESVGHLLKLNALAMNRPDIAGTYDALFEAFLNMIALQVSYFPRMKGKSREEVREALLQQSREHFTI